MSVLQKTESIPKQYYGWTKIEALVKTLSEKIKTKKKFDCIYTISRGGLVPSRLLADRLSIKKIYVDEKTIPPASLVVDDIFDSGHTFKKINEISRSPETQTFATLVARYGLRFPPQLIFSDTTQSNEVVVFPWDRFEYGLPFGY